MTLVMLLVAALGGVTVASGSVSFERTDIALPSGPDSVAIGDLDGRQGKDIAVALWSPGSVGVMLNNGDGTFAPMQEYTAGPECAGVAVDVTLGDVTRPAPGNRLQPDGKLDAYVACTPYVVRLTGDGTGALGNPEAIDLGVQQYLGSGTLDMLTLMRRPDGNPVPLLVLQHAAGSFGRELCISYELEPGQLVCNSTPVQGPLAVGDLNGSAAGVPPDEIVTSEGGEKMGIFGFAPQFPLVWSDSTRNVPGDPMGQPGLESATVGDLDDDRDLDVLVGQPVNSLNARVASIHYFKWDPTGSGGLEQVATTLPSTPGVDAVAIADVDADACNDVVAAGTYGTGMVHLGDGGGFDGGRDLPQIGYQNPATATRVTMAVDDLTGDGLPEIVIADKGHSAVMVYRNTSERTSGACADIPPTAIDDVAVVGEDAGVTAIDVRANDTDPDGGAISITAVTQPAHGSTAIAGGGMTYRPDPDYCNDLGGAPDTFTYTLNGGSIATVAVTVKCVDDGPPVTTGPALPPPPIPRDCGTPGTAPFVVGTPGDDVLVGTTGRDVLSGRGGDDCLFGRSGDDRLSGGTGADTLRGSSGSDRMNGDAGDDRIDGSNGNDTITPGAGKDRVTAGGGNDTISARDGARDTIDCGGGHDNVKSADRSDRVNRNCERVKRAVRRAR